MMQCHIPSMQAGSWRRCNRCAALQLMPVHDAVQVLDDSTDQKTRDLVDDKCLEWRERGVNCTCVRRTNRQGYKAGALKEVGMCCALLPAPSACRMRGGPLPGVPAHGLDPGTGSWRASVEGICMSLMQTLCASEPLYLRENVTEPLHRTCMLWSHYVSSLRSLFPWL